MGQLGVGGQGAHLEQDGQDQPEHVDLAEHLDRAPGGGDLGDEDVLEDEDEDDGGDRPAHLFAHDRPPAEGAST